MSFDLVGSWDNSAVGQQCFQTADIEVGNSYGSNLSSLDQSFHGFPSFRRVDLGEFENTSVRVDGEPLITGDESTVEKLAACKPYRK